MDHRGISQWKTNKKETNNEIYVNRLNFTGYILGLGGLWNRSKRKDNRQYSIENRAIRIEDQPPLYLYNKFQINIAGAVLQTLMTIM